MSKSDSAFDQWLTNKANEAEPLPYNDLYWQKAKTMLAIEKRGNWRFLFFLFSSIITFISMLTLVLLLGSNANGNRLMAQDIISRNPSATIQSTSKNSLPIKPITYKPFLNQNRFSQKKQNTPTYTVQLNSHKNVKAKSQNSNHTQNPLLNNNTDQISYSEPTIEPQAIETEREAYSSLENDSRYGLNGFQFAIPKLDTLKLKNLNISLPTPPSWTKPFVSIQLGINQILGNSTNQFSPKIDAAILGHYPLNRTCWIIGGIAYKQINTNIAPRVYQQTNYGFGKVSTQISLQTKSLDYIAVPILLGYRPWTRHEFNFGFQMLFLVRTVETKTTTQNGDNQTHDKSTVYGYFDASAPIDLQLNFNYRYYFKQGIYGFTGLGYGLTDFTQNAVYKNQEKNQHKFISLGLGFRIK